MPAADIIECTSSDTGWFTSGKCILKFLKCFTTLFSLFILEIQKMMYGFGDSKCPLKETAELVENILKEQLIQFLNLLFEVAATIESKKIGVREFLILLR